MISLIITVVSNSRKGSGTLVRYNPSGSSSLSIFYHISNISTIRLLEIMSSLYCVFVKQPSAFAEWL